MFLFKSHKKLDHKQSSVVGFVLAVLSILTTAIAAYIFPLLGAWLNYQGVYHLDLFLLIFFIVLFLAVQGLILFGFPLYYAKDKKSHMTGFQILLYAFMWMLIAVGIISALSVSFNDGSSETFNLDDFALEEVQ